MQSFNVRLAGIPMEFQTEYDFSKERCSVFLTDEAPLFSVRAEERYLEALRRIFRETAEEQGKTPPTYSDEYMEYLGLNCGSLEKLLPYRILMFHSAAVAYGGKAYLFTGKSGVGKTTHLRLWLKTIEGSRLLDGDKPLLTFTENGILVSGSPWDRKEAHLAPNETLPLGGICLLSQSPENRMEAAELSGIFDALLGQCHIPDVPEGMRVAVRLLSGFSRVPLYRFACNTEDEAARTSFRTMVGTEKDKLLFSRPPALD